jgi:hypothetical protein
MLYISHQIFFVSNIYNLMSLKSYNQYLIEVAPLGNAADTSLTSLKLGSGAGLSGIPSKRAGELYTAHILFDKILSTRPQQIKQIFTSVIARGELADDPEFENQIREIIRNLPALKGSAKKSSNTMLAKIQKRKKREKDGLNNVVARTHSGPDGNSGDGGGEGGGEGG